MKRLHMLLAIVLCMSIVSHASVIIIDDGTNQLRTPQPSPAQAYGYDFTVVGSENLTITALGVWDDDADDAVSTTPGQTGGTPDGLVGDVTVRLWDHASPSSPLATVTISAGGTDGYLSGEFRFKELASSVVLTAGGAYQLTAYYASATDLLHHFKDPADFTYSSDVGNFVARYCLNGTATQIATGYGGGNVTTATGKAFIGPNMQYVPEPASLVLLSFGGAAVLIRKKR